MASSQEKAQCVVWLVETKSPIAVQRKFKSHYGKKALDIKLTNVKHSQAPDIIRLTEAAQFLGSRDDLALPP